MVPDDSPDPDNTELAFTYGELPVFPLANTLILPHTHLPLNIFEPRYIDMINAAFLQSRLIVMEHPCPRKNLSPDQDSETDQPDSESSLQKPSPAALVGSVKPLLHGTGCIGKIVRFEDNDGTYAIVLRGLIRCRLVRETQSHKRFRTFLVDTAPFADDRNPERAENLPNRDRLLTAFEEYLRAHEVSVDWKLIRRLPDWILLNSIAISCPFDTNEQQAFLRIVDFADRAKTLESLLRIFNASSDHSAN